METKRKGAIRAERDRNDQCRIEKSLPPSGMAFTRLDLSGYRELAGYWRSPQEIAQELRPGQRHQLLTYIQ
jgi:hypothetical protein